jgi:anti-sigma factor ChrR (cupin superfamily)
MTPEPGDQAWDALLDGEPGLDAEMDDVAMLLAYAAPVATPSPSLRERLLGGLSSPLNTAQNIVVRATEGEWLTPFPGVEVRTLSTNPVTGDMTSVVRLAPGANYAPHRHGGSEHCYVLEGDLIFEDHTLLAGDYSVSAPGTLHTRSTTRNGCMLLIVHNVRDEVLAGAAIDQHA